MSNLSCLPMSILDLPSSLDGVPPKLYLRRCLRACAKKGDSPFAEEGQSPFFAQALSPDAPISVPLPEALLRVARSAAGPGDPRRASSCGASGPDVSLDSGRRLARMLGEGACRLGR